MHGSLTGKWQNWGAPEMLGWFSTLDVLGFLLQQVEIWVLKVGLHAPRAEGNKHKKDSYLFPFIEILLQNNYAF